MRSRTNKLRNLVATYWQPTVFYGILIVFFGLLLWFKLGTLLGNYSQDELDTLRSAHGLREIMHHPINAPFTIVAYLFRVAHFSGHDLFSLRAAATLFGLLTLTTFYWLVRHWHGERTAILGTILFGCSAWFLHTARLGTPEVLLFVLASLAAGSVWLKHTDNRLVLVIGFVLAATLLYIPGLVWFLLILGIWQAKTIARLFREHLGMMLAGIAAILALISPLVWAAYKSPALLKTIAGLPAQGWPDPVDSLLRLVHIPVNLIARGPLEPEHWLGRLALLDAFSITMLALGIYLYIRHWRLVRSKLMAVVLVVGVILASLGGAVTIAILAPFLYIMIAAGVGFMLDRWYSVFPRNAIAQTVGVVLISLAVISASWYGLRQYYVAWPNAPATKQTFVVQ